MAAFQAPGFVNDLSTVQNICVLMHPHSVTRNASIVEYNLVPSATAVNGLSSLLAANTTHVTCADVCGTIPSLRPLERRLSNSVKVDDLDCITHPKTVIGFWLVIKNM